MTTAPASDALTAAAGTVGDVFALYDSAVVNAVDDHDTYDYWTLVRRLHMIHRMFPIAVYGLGEAAHLPRPARALANLIYVASLNDQDWLWMCRTLRDHGLDATLLLAQARAALDMPSSVGGAAAQSG